MSFVPPDPGAPGATADAWVPPLPIRVIGQRQEVSIELANHSELAEVKADVDRAISRLENIKQTG